MNTSIWQILFLLLLAYTVVPTLLIRMLHIGAMSRIPKGGNMVAITFDDGPDPEYTPQILQILERFKVKACFFVVGSKAQANPEIMRQIVLAGHEIGNHGYRHKPVWLLGPVATAKDIDDTDRAIEALTGQQPRYYRPNWGLFNLFSILFYRLKGAKVVLWTFMSWDWTRKCSPQSITELVLKRVRDGSILVLHDSDKTAGATRGAPAQVIAALPGIMEGIQRKGLKIVPLKDIIKESR